MLAAQSHKGINLVQPGILGQGLGYDLHGVGEGLNGQLLATAHGCGILPQTQGQLYLGGTAAWNQQLVLDDNAYNPQGVFHGPVQLIDHVLGSAAEDNGHGLGVLALFDEGHLLVADLSLLNEACLPQVFCRQVVDAGDNPSACGTRQLLHVALLDAANCVDAGLGQEVLGQVIDAFLTEDDVSAGLDDGVYHALEHGLFLVQESLQLIGRCDLDLGVDLGLLDLDGCIEHSDLGACDFLWHIGMEPVLIDHHAVYEH